MKRIWRQFSDVLRYVQIPTEHKQIIFYSEGKNYWPHLKGLVEETLDRSEVRICYISSELDDPGLAVVHEQFSSFFVDMGFIRNWFFETIECDVVVMTMPDLGNFQIKRSTKPVHYVYVQHSLVSLHTAYRSGAFDNYDTIFCAGPHHIAEVRAMEAKFNTPRKTVVEHGYARIEELKLAVSHRVADVQKQSKEASPVALIAPSWGEHSLIEAGLAPSIIEELSAAGYNIILRPHPQTTRLHPNLLADIKRRFEKIDGFSVEDNVAGMDSLFESSIMISDWSGAAIEYGIGLSKPVVFVDVPQKINNPDHLKVGLESLESRLRHRLGIVVPQDNFKLDGLDKFEQNDDTSKIVYNDANARGADALIAIWKDCTSKRRKH